LSKSTKLLFVYGTLRQEFNHPLTQILKIHGYFYGNAKVQGYLYDVGGYPGMVLTNEPCNWVYGEVIKIDSIDLVFSKLDEYEQIGKGYLQPNEYERRIITAHCAADTVSCWSYVYNWSVEGKIPIASGNYLNYFKNQ